LPKMRGDFRHSRKRNIEFGTRRFFAQRKKTANGGLLSNIVVEISGIRQHSHLAVFEAVGAGNFANSWLRSPWRRQEMASLQGFWCKFPTQLNRELFRRNREFKSRNREFYRLELESSTEEILGI
jgi:hypothetical protein